MLVSNFKVYENINNTSGPRIILFPGNKQLKSAVPESQLCRIYLSNWKTRNTPLLFQTAMLSIFYLKGFVNGQEKVHVLHRVKRENAVSATHLHRTINTKKFDGCNEGNPFVNDQPNITYPFDHIPFFQSPRVFLHFQRNSFFRNIFNHSKKQKKKKSKKERNEKKKTWDVDK